MPNYPALPQPADRDRIGEILDIVREMRTLAREKHGTTGYYDLRDALGCGPDETTLEAARRVVAERDAARQEIRDALSLGYLREALGLPER